MKVRISHFTTKNIPINKSTTTQYKQVSAKVSAKPTNRTQKETKPNKKSQVIQSLVKKTKLKRTVKSSIKEAVPVSKLSGVKQTRAVLRIEADYAGKTKNSLSKIIEKQMRQEIRKF